MSNGHVNEHLCGTYIFLLLYCPQAVKSERRKNSVNIGVVIALIFSSYEHAQIGIVQFTQFVKYIYTGVLQKTYICNHGDLYIFKLGK